MTPPAPSLTGCYRPQALPVELIDAILASVQVHSDLAKCCRVNKHFLSCCRPALYHRLPVLCGTPLIEPDDYIQGYNLSESSKKLLQTLKANVHLRRYPRKLSLEIVGAEQEWVVNSDEEEGGSDVEEGDTSRGYYEFDYEYGDPSHPLEMFMGLLPRATSVYIDNSAWWWRPVRDVVFGNGARWKEIKVDGELLSEEGDQRDLRELRNLEKLECTSMGYTGLPDQNLPRTLRTLRTWGYQLPKGKSSVDYQLRHLRATMFAETIIHLPAYQQLRHLHLDQSSDAFEPLPPTALLDFQSLPNLRSLSFTLNGQLYSHATATASLLAHLPPSLSRLEFPDKVPFDVLDHFVKHRSNQTPLAIGLQEVVASEEVDKKEFDQLATLCREQRIEIFSIPPPNYSWRRCSRCKPLPPSSQLTRIYFVQSSEGESSGRRRT